MIFLCNSSLQDNQITFAPKQRPLTYTKNACCMLAIKSFKARFSVDVAFTELQGKEDQLTLPKINNRLTLKIRSFPKRKTESLQPHHWVPGLFKKKCLGVWGGWLGGNGVRSQLHFFRPELIWTAMPHVQIHSPHGDYQILGTKSSLAHWKTMGENLAQLTDIDIPETLRKRNKYIFAI